MRNISTAARRDLTLVVIVVLSIALGFSLAANFYRHTSAVAVAAPPKAATENWQDAFVVIAESMAPSVVHITSEKMVKRPSLPGFDDFFSWPFGPQRRSPDTEPQLTKATGSGVIVRADGYIMTNNHVVAGADRVIVKLIDGREFNGKVLRDPRTDLALVKIEAKDLLAAQFADSDKAKVGQWVAAIGNPFQLRNTVTVGVVSAIHKESDPENPLPYPESIQTDAAINFGNSGGPLVDLEGRILGINGAIYSASGGNVGIGFAIPSNTARDVMTQLIDKGKVVRGYLGLLPADLTPVLQDKLGSKTGALVESVDKGSPAEKGGIKVKDVVTSVDGKPVRSGSELRRVVQRIAPGAAVKVVLIRDKKQMTLTIKLGEAPSGEEESGTETGDKIGLSVQPLTPEIAKQLNIDESIKGVVVRKVEAGSAADRAGIRQDDVITEIDDDPVTSVASFSKATGKLKSGDTAIVVVQRGERSVIIEMRID